MKYLFLLFFLFFFSCEKKREIAQIKFKAYSVELPDEFKQESIDSHLTTNYYFSNGDTLDFVNDATPEEDLIYTKKDDSTYVIKVLFGAPEGAEFGGKIYTDNKNSFYLSTDAGKIPKEYRGLSGHIIIFEINTNIKNPMFKNDF
ncbi:hypothetical protein [Emticicia fontis]